MPSSATSVMSTDNFPPPSITPWVENLMIFAWYGMAATTSLRATTSSISCRETRTTTLISGTATGSCPRAGASSRIEAHTTSGVTRAGVHHLHRATMAAPRRLLGFLVFDLCHDGLVDRSRDPE